MYQKRKTLLITVLIFITVMVLVAGITPIVISTRYEKVMERRLPEWIAKATDSLYQVSVNDINISMFSKNISIAHLVLKPDSNRLKYLKNTRRLPKAIFTASIKKVQIKTIHWADLLADKELNCKSVILEQPSVIIDQPDSLYVDKASEKNKISIARFHIGLVEILQPSIAYRNYKENDSTEVYWKGGSIRMHSWLFDSQLEEDTARFFYANGGTIQVDSAVYKKRNSFYAFTSGKIQFISKENSLELNNMSIMPALSNEEFYKKTGFRTEIFSVHIPQIIFQGFNWQQISKGVFKVRSIIVNRPVANVYLDRLQPPPPFKKRVFPVQLLQKIKVPVAIDLLKIADGRLDYTERSNITKMQGTLPLSELNMTLTNITNIKEKLKANSVCNVSIRTTLFNSQLVAQMHFPLRDTVGAFQVTASSQTPLDGSLINPLMRTLASMEIESLNLNKADFKIDSDGRAVKGDFLFLYDNLDLKILKLTEDGRFKGKSIMSFIMNKALLYPSNPLPGLSPRSVNVSLMRKPGQSFFNFLWASIRKGALLTAGRNAQLSTMAEQ